MRISSMILDSATTNTLHYYLFFLWCFTTQSNSLTCRCLERFRTERTYHGCGRDGNCTTDGVCYVDLRVLDSPAPNRYTYGCLDNKFLLGASIVNSTCNNNVVNSRSALLCCNDANFCNDDLRPQDLLLRSTSMTVLLPSLPSSSPTASVDLASTSPPHHSRGVIIASVLSCVVALLIVSLLVLAFVLYQRRGKLAASDDTIKGKTLTIPIDAIDMTVTSGSGSGLPFLIQRTVARSIKITEMIGNGRYGQVYLGYYQGDPVAVKKFASWDENSWVRETEIYNTLLLRHDNILGFFASDMVSNNGVTELWLITQYHQLGSLYDYLNREAVSSKVMLQMAISTCSGLAHLHTELFGTLAKLAIAHRDMKTKNVLVKNNLTCCIADFGLAVFKNQNEMNIPTNPKQGTKRYMAPEILNESINMKSFESFKQADVYALGLTLWELCRRCTGKTGVPEDYAVPLHDLVPPDPSFEDMKRVVVMERRQPEIPPRWNMEELLREMTKVMKECWYYTSTARPTAVYLKKKLLKMSQQLERNDSVEADSHK